MRIAVDLQGMQTSGSRNRGIGRYVQSLVEGLLRLPTANSYRLIANGSLPTPEFALPEGMKVDTVAFPTPGGGSYNDLLMRANLLAQDADACFLPSPIEMTDAAVPDLADFPGTRYVVCYDLVPYLFADTYLTDPNLRSMYTRRLRNVRNADYVFAISESTRQDTIRHLGVPAERVFHIGAGASDFFRPVEPGETDTWRRHFAEKFAVGRPFVLYTGGEDWRKNIEGLIEAFALLPADLRAGYQLVVACKMSAEGGARLRLLAADAGLPPDAVVLTGFVTDEELRALYSLCELFVFPSFYEGFGLPLVEAMACGAPAITADNSSLREIVTSPDLLFDAGSPTSIAQRIESVLRDDALRARLRAQAPAEAANHTWDAVAARVHAVLEQAPPRPGTSLALARFRQETGPDTRPTLAFFSPLRPMESGISDYSEELLKPMSEDYVLDLYIDDGYTPDHESTQGNRVFRYAAFDSVLAMRRRDYHAALYQMGNSVYHAYMYALLRRFAGITVLHDYAMCGMINHSGHYRPYLGISLREELVHSYGVARAEQILSDLGTEKYSITDLPALGIYGNRRIFTRSAGVIVHNRWAYDRAVEDHADCRTPVALIPHEAPFVATEIPDDERRRLRRKWDVPSDALVFASCGAIAETKRPITILDAFRAILGENPKAFLLFGGGIHMEGDFKAEVAKRGLTDRVRITGFVAGMAAFNELIVISDVCIALRFPSNGETSGALIRMLAHGKPCIVTDIGSFSDFPDDTVHKLPSPDAGDEVGRLTAAFRLLADNVDYREGLGRRAVAHMRGEHAPERCARLYHDFIETVMADPRTRQRLLADYVARELSKIGGGEDAATRFAPFGGIFGG